MLVKIIMSKEMTKGGKKVEFVGYFFFSRPGHILSRKTTTTKQQQQQLNSMIEQAERATFCTVPRPTQAMAWLLFNCSSKGSVGLVLLEQYKLYEQIGRWRDTYQRQHVTKHNKILVSLPIYFFYQKKKLSFSISSLNTKVARQCRCRMCS